MKKKKQAPKEDLSTMEALTKGPNFKQAGPVPPPHDALTYDDRRIELAYKLKALGDEVANIFNEGIALGCAPMFNIVPGPSGLFVAQVQLSLMLLPRG